MTERNKELLFEFTKTIVVPEINLDERIKLVSTFLTALDVTKKEIQELLAEATLGELPKQKNYIICIWYPSLCRR